MRNAAAISTQSEPDHTALFKSTETYRAGADGQTKTTALLRALALLLEDLLLLDSGTPELLRNTDLRAELFTARETLHTQTSLFKQCAAAMIAFNNEVADIDCGGDLTDANAAE